MADTTADAPLIALDDIRKSYGGGDTPAIDVLRGVSVSIGAGEFVAIVGASGSGKSTLMHILGCLDRAGSGSYRFAGQDVATLDADALAQLRREAFGFVFQSYHLIPTACARENVEVPGLYAGMPADARARRATALLSRLGLSDRLDHRPSQLSGGQQQRVSIARALMNGGRVILADEPTGALDTRSGAEVMALLRELAHAGHTVIVITHDRDVAAHARRVIEIRDGSIVADTRTEPGTTAPTAPTVDSDAPCTTPTPDAAPPAQAKPGEHRTPRALRPWTDALEAMHAAWRVLWINRFRTLLTLLGIIIGVASVILMLAIGTGAERKMIAEMEVFGGNRLYVVPGGNSRRERARRLTESDVEWVREVPNVAIAMPFLSGTVTLRHGNVDHAASGWGVTTDFPKLLNWPVKHGVFFTAEDERTLATVAVIGHRVSEKLFAASDPLGRYILVDNVPFQVIGVLAEKGALSGSDNGDDMVVFPFRTASRRIYGTTDVSWISAQIKELKLSKTTVDDISTTLAAARGAKDFEVYDAAAAVAAQTATQGAMTLLLSAMAAISLLVGGIGVMNIMLMTVRERTREIGVRIAVGARRRDIVRQFLTEAVLVSGIGGCVGVVAGLAIGAALLGMGVPVMFSLTAIVGAFACAVATGLVFGLMPARRAAALDPVVALAGQ